MLVSHNLDRKWVLNDSVARGVKKMHQKLHLKEFKEVCSY